MKRSTINDLVRDAVDFLNKCQFYLPPFAFWTPADWAKKGEESREIIDRQLGWDVTDFGQGQFEKVGAILFTLRNGSVTDLKRGKGKLYAEKIMVLQPGQLLPMHFHQTKTEDIINRGGGHLVVKLYKADNDNNFSKDEISFSLDGVIHRIQAGHTVTLNPGESITITPRLYHSFWAEDEPVLAGEVSTVNDDQHDNHFYDAIPRFPTIEEDEPPLYFLVSDYPKFIGRR